MDFSYQDYILKLHIHSFLALTLLLYLYLTKLDSFFSIVLFLNKEFRMHAVQIVCSQEDNISESL